MSNRLSNGISACNGIQENNDVPASNGIPKNNGVLKNNDVPASNGVPKNNDYWKNNRVSENYDYLTNNGVSENNGVPQNNDYWKNNGVPENYDYLTNNGVSENNGVPQNNDYWKNNGVPENYDYLTNNGVSENNGVPQNNDYWKNNGVPENNSIPANNSVQVTHRRKRRDPNYVALLQTGYPMDYLPHLQQESENSVNSDRIESRTYSVQRLLEDTHKKTWKRPSAIEELLLRKQARLMLQVTPTHSATSGSLILAPSPDFLSRGSETDNINFAMNMVKSIFEKSYMPVIDEESFEVSTVFRLKGKSVIPKITRKEGFRASLNSGYFVPVEPFNAATRNLEVVPTAERMLFNRKVLRESGPNCNLNGQLIPAPFDSTFSSGPSRLTLLAPVIKYDITVGEIRRRIMGPEAFNFSYLGAFLRRAKLPAKSCQLMEELAVVGLSITRGRRRADVTLFSGITEQEALTLVHDYTMLTRQAFPVRQLADKAVNDCLRRNIGEQREDIVIAERRRKLINAQEVIGEFMNVLKMDRSPISDQEPSIVLPPTIQEPLDQYSMLTHGFGTLGLQVGIQAFANFVKHQHVKVSNKNIPGNVDQ